VEENNTYGMVLVRRTVGGQSVIGHTRADTFTIYAALEGLFATGQTLEILGYYPNTTSWTRPDLYNDTREAEGREYP
jgi:hypothetical protein